MIRPSVRTLGLVVVVLSIVASGCSLFDDDDSTAPLERPPEGNISYVSTPCGGDETCARDWSLDIYRSEDAGPNPVLIWIHGGGFISGDKFFGLPADLRSFLDDGWDVVAANYRLSIDGRNRFPAAVQDVKQVVRWVKANAAQQDWDAEAVAAMGHSAGGNLAAMLAVTNNDPTLEPTGLTPELAAVDSSVIAAISLAGVVDIPIWAAVPGWADPVMAYIGCVDCPEQMAAASVAPYVDADSSPLFLVHGGEDVIAAPEQGEVVVAAYDEAGIGEDVEMIVVDDGPEDDRGHSPDLGRFADDLLDFLDSAR